MAGVPCEAVVLKGVCGYCYVIADSYSACHYRSCIYSHIITDYRLAAFSKSYRNVLVETKIPANALCHNERSETMLHFQASAYIGCMYPASTLSL